VAGDILLHSSELRRAIELCEKKPPTNEDCIKFEQRAANNATLKDIIPFDELENNGIRVYSRWPDKNGIGPRVARPHNHYDAMDRDTAKDRHFVVNLQVDYEAAYEAAHAKVSMADWAHVASALKKVQDDFRRKKKADKDKLVARTVLFLFQLLATAIT
jgi:hypothetical protein